MGARYIKPSRDGTYEIGESSVTFEPGKVTVRGDTTTEFAAAVTITALIGGAFNLGTKALTSTERGR